jgi:hypothetical protein
VNAGIGPHVEAAGVEAREDEDDRFERVDAQVRRRCRVCRASVEDDLHEAVGKRATHHHVALRRMQHERRVHALEDAVLGERDLAASALLGRRPDHQDVPGERPTGLRQGQAGPERAAGDDVVPAGVPDARQRVVLGQDRDGRAGLGPT